MSMTKREKILIIIVLVLAVLCVYFIYFLQPCMKELDELDAEKTSKELSVSANEQIKSSIEDINKEIAENEKQIAQFSDTMVSGFDQPAVLVYLEETINEYARKEMYEFEETTDVGQLKVSRVKATLEGKYEDLKNILKSLSEGEYFVKVIELKVDFEPIIVPSVPPEEGEEQTEEPEPTEVAVPAPQDGTLKITLILEFYNLGSDIPPGKPYPFSNGYSYGGDIFS